MKHLADRLRLVMGWRGLSSRAWAEKAGLSENALNTFFLRATKKPGAHLRGPTVFALARAAEVSGDWLATGDGDPETFSPLPGDPDPKDLVAGLGKASGVSDDVLSAFRAHRKPGASPLYWMALLLALSQDKPVKTLPRAKSS